MTHFTDPLFSHTTVCLGKGHTTRRPDQVTCLACRKDPTFWRAWRVTTSERWPSLPGDLPRNDPPHCGVTP